MQVSSSVTARAAWAVLLVCLLPVFVLPARIAAAGPEPHRGGAAERAPTALEAAFSTRAGQPLSLFGYDLFEANLPVPPPPVGAVQDDYRLAVGDKVTVTLRGRQSSSGHYGIDTTGVLLVEALRPITAAGRTLGQVRAELEAEVRASYPGTEAFVSLAVLSRVSVVIVGAVARPGRVEVGAQSTVLDALTAAGGVTRGGSLRRIRLVSGAAHHGVDLYRLVLDGTGAATMRLRDGDRIVVPLLGPTVAVAGAVGRAGIYELPDGSDAVDAAEAIELAAGRRHRGEADLLRLTYARTGNETAVPIDPTDTAPLADGDIVLVRPSRGGRLGTVTLTGHVRHPGPRALASTPTAAGLVAADELPPGTYLPFAAIERTDPETLARTLVAVDLEAVVEDRNEVRLEDGDRLIVLGSEDIGFLTSAPVLALLSGRHPPAVPDCAGLSVLARRIRADPGGPLAAGLLARAAVALVPAPALCPPVFDRHPDLLSFTLDHGVLIRDGVARPGIYPAAGRVSIDRLVRVAGRTAGHAASPVENGEPLAVVRAGRGETVHGTWAKRGDIVEARPRTYAIEGHVRHPGLRPLAAGATLRTAIAAGDLAKDAYPLAAILERYDTDRLTRTRVVFSPAEVFAGRMDLSLERGDRIRFLSMDEIRRFGGSGFGHAGAGEQGASRGAPDDDGRTVLAERAVEIRGAVRHPGRYPVAGTSTLGALLAASGGLAQDADARAVEIVDPASGGTGPGAGPRTIDLALPGAERMEIRLGNVVRVHRRAGSGSPQRATVTGEVKRPGSYEFTSGETLSSLLRRAGGLTDTAYPAGAVFTRESARLREADAFTRAAAELDRKTALLLLGDEPPPEEHVRAVRTLASDLRTARAVGRITVEADMAVLALRPDLDIMLEDGDLIMIPRRPLTVAVSGEVLAPAFLQFSAGKEAADYIRDAGGTTRNADEGRAFVILPDGRSQPLGISFWNHRPVFVPPGATIVVPRDPEPLDLLEMTRSVGSILGQMATAAASLAILGRQ